MDNFSGKKGGGRKKFIQENIHPWFAQKTFYIEKRKIVK